MIRFILYIQSVDIFYREFFMRSSRQGSCGFNMASMDVALELMRGYENSFVNEIPERLRCLICFLPSRDPNLLSCCGIKACRSCIDRVKFQGNPCPHCQEVHYDTMLDKQLSREILSLKVYCKHKEKGCEWKGELRDADKHENEDCQMKGATCPHCNGLEVHKEDCPKQPFDVFQGRAILKIKQLDEEVKSLKLKLQEINKGTGNVLTVHSGGFTTGCRISFTLNNNKLFTNGGRGLNVLILNGADYNILGQGIFDTHDSPQCSEDFIKFLDKFPEIGTVVAIAVYDEAQRELSEAAKKAISSLGSNLIDTLDFRHSYSLIAIKGFSAYSLESTGGINAAATVSYWLPEGGTNKIEERVVIKATSSSSCSANVKDAVTAFHGEEKFTTTVELKPLDKGICFGAINVAESKVKLKYFDSDQNLAKSIGNRSRNNNCLYVLSMVGGGTDQLMSEGLRYGLESLGSNLHDKIFAGSSWTLIHKISSPSQVEAWHRSAQVAVAITVVKE